MWYGYLADAVVAVHVAYVGYVVLGQFAIWIGLLFRRQWARNFWFRATHFAAIAYVAFEEFAGLTCPLTTWENDLRIKAGQSVTEGTFMGRFLHDLLFVTWSDNVVMWLHIGCAAIVLLTLVLFPPRRPKWLRLKPLAPALPAVKE